MQVKYFLDESGIIRRTDTQVFGRYLQVNLERNEVTVVDSEDDCIVGEFTLWNSLLEPENIVFNATLYQLKKFLQELSNLNEKADTIGEGKLANIKEQAEYLLNKLNKE